ncbi:MAG TPA: hypothetical protein VHW09_20450 [Bryobacteraceae bacterium]|jgi:methyl-accepting chemotaxis protein|nr:hypothetical protein [Bryobacteraceae bacterium]
MKKGIESRIEVETVFLADLLALNGAIEAADDQAAGKPFTPAADELRALVNRQEQPAGQVF